MANELIDPADIIGNKGILEARSLDDLAQERALYEEDRGTFMDLISAGWASTGNIMELHGRGQELGTGTGAFITKLGQRIQASPLARVDAGTFYGDDGRIKEIAKIAASALPSLAYVAGAGIAGTLTPAGPAGGMVAALAAMGNTFGGGVYAKAYEEITIENPDMPEAERQAYAKREAAIELGSEVVGTGAAFVTGGILGKAGSKFMKTGLRGLLDSGEYTAQQVIAKAIKEKGGADLAKALIAGGVSDGGSEVVAEVLSHANREAVGLETGDTDLVNLFIGSMLPGAVVAGGGYAFTRGEITKVREKLEESLGSEDATTRQAAINAMSKQIARVDPEFGPIFKERMDTLNFEGPIDLETALTQEAQEARIKESIIVSPETVVESAGIPVSSDPVAQAQAEDRAEAEALPEVYEEVRVLDEGFVEGGVGIPIPEVEPMVKEVDNFMGIAGVSEAMRQSTWYKDSVAGLDEEAIKDLDPMTEVTSKLYEVIERGDARSARVSQGMEKVLLDTNTLLETVDLEEGDRLQKSIDKTQGQIANEVTAHVKASVVGKVTPVTKEVPVAPKPKEAPVAPVVPKAPVVPVKAKKPVKVPKKDISAKTIEDPTLLKGKELENAENLIKQGVKPDDAAVLAKRGIREVTKPIAVETQTTKTKKGGKAFSSSRYTDGSTLERSDVETVGKEYKVTKDGKVYRSSSQTQGHSFIQGEGKLELWEEKTRETVEDKPRVSIREEGKANVEAFLEEYTHADIAKGHKGLTDSKSLANEALVNTVAAGKKLTIGNVREEMRKVVTRERNRQEATRMAKEGVRTDIASFEEVQERAEVAIEAEDVAVELEAEDIEDIGEVAPEVATTQYKQVGKGRYELKNFWYVNGTKVSKSPDAVQKIGTADGRYYVESQIIDGEVNVTLLSEGEVVQRNFKNPDEAMEWVRENDESQAQIEKERKGGVSPETKKKTVIRRRKKVQEELESLSPFAQQVEDRLRGISPQIAVVRMLDEFDGQERNIKGDNKKIYEELKERRDNWVSVSEALESKFPNALVLLDSLQSSFLPENKGFVALAKLLKNRANVERLKDVKVILGNTNSYNGEIGVITLKGASSYASKLHEIVHALTAHEVGGSKEIQELMSKVQEQAIKDGLLTQEDLSVLKGLKTSQEFKQVEADGYTFKNRDVAYAMLNEHEFLAQAFNNPEVQQLMGDTKLGKKSIFDALVDWVLKVLNLDSTHHTAMAEVLKIVEDVSWMDTKGGDGIFETLEVKTDAETAAIVAGKDIKKSLKEKFWEQKKDIQKFAEDLARPVSDIIEARSKKIHGSLMKFESELIQNQKEYSRKTNQFMRWYQKLTESQQVRYNLALMNSNTKENQKIIDEIPKEAMSPLREVLDDLRQRQENVGLGTADRAYYFPRRVQDVDGLMAYMMKDSETKGPLGVAMEEEKKRLGVVELTEEQKTQVVTNIFQQGYMKQLPRPGASKKRRVPFVSRDTYKFYANANDSLMAHIFEMNEKIGQREFIGGSTRKRRIAELTKDFKAIEKMEDGTKRAQAIAEYDRKADALEDLEQDLQDSLAAMVYTELGEQDGQAQRDVIELLNARLRQKGAHGVVENFRNVAYIATMGNFLSAITQLGDIPILLYAHGVNRESLSAVGTAFKNVWKIARNEMRGQVGTTEAFVDQADFTNQLREFSNGSLTAKWVDKVFQLSGLKYTDLVGKEAFMQASFSKWKKVKNKDAFIAKFGPMFGKETERVWQDIQLGKKSEKDVLTVLIAELAEWQPVSLSQQSKGYLTSGNGRLFYMLKTFTLRATSGALREGAKEINKGGAKNIAKGIAKISSILMIYAVAGAGPDELKDLLRGKESSIKDNVFDNLLQMGFMSKYSLEKGVREDGLAKGLMASLLPPVRFLDSFGADVYGAFSEEKEFKAKSLTSIPLVGSLLYGRSPAGQATYKGMERRDILKKIKENKKDRRGAYAGGLSKEIREYNKGVSGDKRITSTTVSRAYKGD